MSTQQITTDGQRKYRIVAAGSGMVRIVGLLRESEWTGVRKAELFTMREIHGDLLHDESLKGQLPQVGHTFPLALLRAQGRTGKAMTGHLSAISEQRKAERGAYKALQAIKYRIL